MCNARWPLPTDISDIKQNNSNEIFLTFETMNYWTELSIEYANQRSYLDDLFHVYPTIPEGIRELNTDRWEILKKHLKNKITKP